MHVLMSCMKNEGPFVLEFVAHHLALGFDQVMIASNDCSDGTDALLEAMQAGGFVRHLRNEVQQGEIPQHSGYAKMRAAFGLAGVDWLMILDADEFLHVSTGDGTVQALTAAAPENVDIIALNAKTFGTDLGAQWQAGRVCAQFTYRMGLTSPHNAVIKSLTRAPLRFRALHNHHPIGFRGEGPLSVLRGDGSMFEISDQKPIWKQLRHAPKGKIGHALAHYNHYAIKTYDSFLVRRERGNGAAAKNALVNQRYTDDYFVTFIRASAFDDSIAIYAPKVMEKMAQMLAHPQIAAAQAEAEQRYRALLQEIVPHDI